LVERHRITGDAAFGYLSRASQEVVNMMLTAVARHLVEPVRWRLCCRDARPRSSRERCTASPDTCELAVRGHDAGRYARSGGPGSTANSGGLA